MPSLRGIAAAQQAYTQEAHLRMGQVSIFGLLQSTVLGPLGLLVYPLILVNYITEVLLVTSKAVFLFVLSGINFS